MPHANPGEKHVFFCYFFHFCNFFVLKYGKFQTQNINFNISKTNKSMITIRKKISVEVVPLEFMFADETL